VINPHLTDSIPRRLHVARITQRHPGNARLDSSTSHTVFQAMQPLVERIAFDDLYLDQIVIHGLQIIKPASVDDSNGKTSEKRGRSPITQAHYELALR
jgi:hypothetical protein